VKKLMPVSGDQSKLSYGSDKAVYAQVIYAAREEMAIKLADVILRRTGLGSIGRPDDSTLENIAEIMALELGWPTEKKNLEVEEVKAIYRKHGLRDRMVDDLESS
jgi:glycerol-3-phosphate dehydrogenase